MIHDPTDAPRRRLLSNLERVAESMRSRDDRFLSAVAGMLDQVAYDHRGGLCGYCSEPLVGDCPAASAASELGLAWLLAPVSP
jgi:hypothetical protein